jgi:hypothetical protein
MIKMPPPSPCKHGTPIDEPCPYCEEEYSIKGS